ncbi:hypothetical protein Pfo_030979 [Paulownia fortunei]|nr:hypothetical protein Pfo_030979 [Paulownia fortunei]
MAYAALVSLAQTIDQLLNYDLYSIFLHETQKTISIYEYVIFLQAFLEDFPEKAKSLEGRIKDVANEAEDIIEDFLWKQIRSRFRLIKWSVGLAKVKFKHQLTKVEEEINSIAEKVMDIKNSFRIKDVQLGDSLAAGSSSRLSPTGKNHVVGFNDDLIAIKARLCEESSKLQVIPILVSQDYSAQKVFSSLLVSMKQFNTEIPGQSNEENVYKTLKGRRYLIVMDDMWSTEAWDDVKMIFPDDGNGSRIMLTTRLLDVAAYADSSTPLHEMRFMDANQSWNLLQQKVFTHQDCPPELVNIGKKIARSSRGLPLAIVVIAGLLSTVSKSRASWEEIEKNVRSAVSTKDGQFEKILSLSYTHLPHHLRPCFLYMGVFPEDYEIRVSKLIKLWVAEGFMKPSASKTFEEGAEEYLEDLVKRSLIFVSRRKSNGKIKSCSLHDLVRDLCIRKAQEEKFLPDVRDRYVGDVLLKRTKKSALHTYF